MNAAHIYATEALKYVPKILTLQDTNPYSVTYGCFDREYWHYKTSDFPCGMSQEFTLALALVYHCDMPGNLYYQKPRIKDLAFAGMRFAMKSAHADGSCDDYYPYERALGATVYALHACTEAYLLLGEKDGELETFFELRGRWLIENDEAGQLSNHQAIAAAALINVFQISQKDMFKKAAQERVQKALSWQSEEGWFQEYEGCDPGYLTATINFLAHYYRIVKDEALLAPLERAIAFASYFIHPDGSFGGEYGSRNTANFYPHGLEVMGSVVPKALEIADLFLEGIQNGKRMYWDDDRIFGHFVNSCLLAYRDCAADRTGPLERCEDFERFFSQSGLWVIKKDAYYVIVAANKGGVFKAFKDNEQIYSDTGVTGVLEDGRLAVTNLIQRVGADAQNHPIEISGSFCERNKELATPFKLILFRLGLLVLGRWHAGGQLIRKALQKRLILGKKELPISYKRHIEVTAEGVLVKDKISVAGGLKFKHLGIGTDQTSIYIATSNCFQAGSLQPWVSLDEYLNVLHRDKHVEIERKIG